MEDNGGYPTTIEELVKATPTSGDRLIKGDATQKPKHMAVAYMSAGGSSNNAIAEELGMSPAWISTVLSQTEMKEEIKRIQAETFGDDIQKRFHRSLHKSMDVMEGVIEDEGAKDRDRMQAAQWILEKVTGKATQTVEHSGNVISGLLDQLDQMRLADDAKTVGEQIEMIEEKSSQDQMLDAFVAGNIPAKVMVGVRGGEDE